MPLSRVFIANRGEIAVRIIRACQSQKLETVVALSEADRDSLPARLADRSICIGESAPSKSYLNPKAVIAAALGAGADALHPGYGFLSESPQLAALCQANGIIFIGPQPEHIRQMGNKLEARALAQQCGVPVLPGSEKISDVEEALSIVDRIGLPVMLKAAAGGGGRGMKIVNERADLHGTFAAASAEARSAFGDNTLYLERYIPNARHIEVQILGDRHGNVIHVGERDCSLQRRHQKLIEEAPAPAISNDVREQIRHAALKLARRIGYESAGTVEFIYDEDNKTFHFLEMNTRIQVEHPVTEAISGIDLVQQQLRIAAGHALGIAQKDVRISGHAIECRINAESALEGFRPNPGRIVTWRPPLRDYVRLDTHCYEGYVVPTNYDSLLAKLIVCGDNREQAITNMQDALEEFEIDGINTTLPFLQFAIGHRNFAEARVNTRLVDTMVAEMTTSTRDHA